MDLVCKNQIKLASFFWYICDLYYVFYKFMLFWKDLIEATAVSFCFLVQKIIQKLIN
jgi:hypothetical protein